MGKGFSDLSLDAIVNGSHADIDPVIMDDISRFAGFFPTLIKVNTVV